VFRGSVAAAGLVTPWVLRGPRYTRLLPDIYAPSALPVDLELRSRAAYLWADGTGTLTGYSAATLLGAGCAPIDAPAALAVPHAHSRRQAGLRVSRAVLAPDECREEQEVRLTGPLRTAYDLARWLEEIEAVVAVDALCRVSGMKPVEVLEFARRYPGSRGCARLPQVIRLADPRAESAMETRLRLVLVLAGLPLPVAQYPVFGRSGNVVACVDLAYPAHRIAIEYDGADHFTVQRSVLDGTRGTRLADLGWRVYRYFAHDVYRNPARIVAEIARALGLAL
jgi:very-short-patch-repair endonuclease